MLDNKLNFSTSWSFQRLKIISANENLHIYSATAMSFQVQMNPPSAWSIKYLRKADIRYFSPVLSVLLNKGNPFLGKTIPFWERIILAIGHFSETADNFLKKTLIITTSLEKYRFFFGVEDSREFIIFLRYSSIIKGNNIKEYHNFNVCLSNILSAHSQ